MTQADLEATIRDYLNEPDVNGRFSSAALTRFLNRALDRVALAVGWPEGTVTGTWNTNQENPLLEDFLAVLRVYVNGMELTPTSIPIMEGNQLELYDQSGLNQQPEWKTLERAPYQNPSVYPVSAVSGFTGYPVPMVPGYPLRPAYYTRGGNLGIVPIPASGSTVVIDFIVRPGQLSSTAPNGVCVFPEIFREALGRASAAQALSSDKQYQAADWQDQQYRRCVYDPNEGLIKWARQFTNQFVERPQPVTYRTFYQGAVIGSD